MLLMAMMTFSIFSFALLIKWKNIWEFILQNFSIIFVYLILLFLFEGRQFSFGFFFKALAFITLHSLIIFIFSIYKFIKLRLYETKTNR